MKLRSGSIACSSRSRWIIDGNCSRPLIAQRTRRSLKALCRGIREDGAYIEAGENDNLIVQKLEANPNAFGVFGYSFLDQNADKIQGSLVNGVAPEFENIAEQKYPVSRALYFYVKKAHVGKIPGGLSDDVVSQLLACCGNVVRWKRSVEVSADTYENG